MIKIKTDQPLTAEKIKRFHEEVMKGYQEALSAEPPVFAFQRRTVVQ